MPNRSKQSIARHNSSGNRKYNQQKGMEGVYLTAAKLSNMKLIVSVTSRNSKGTDLLITDHNCRKAWTAQVKTNGSPRRDWLLGEHDADNPSESHIFVFVNLKGHQPEFLVVPSQIVAAKKQSVTRRTGSTWHWFDRQHAPYAEGWQEIFAA